MRDDQAKESLLSPDEYDEYFEYKNTRDASSTGPTQNRPRFAWTQFLIRFLTLAGLTVSLMFNALLVYKYTSLIGAPDLGRSRFSGLAYDTPVEYKVHTEYGRNDTKADELWDAIDSSPIIVALTDGYAKAKGLELSARFPWDDSKGIYHIKAFHHLHCLKSMRKAYTDMQRGNPQIVPTGHFHHCLDTLRQDMMCLADDTPMPTINKIHHIGNRQIRQCRDWDKLVAWTQEPERHACYRMLDDYRKVPHTLEQFDYCDKESQYLPVAEHYFEQYGHKNPYGD
ncbi:MAG: hypothetical protein Q9188_001885 [Gyalolechia gomerana]